MFQSGDASGYGDRTQTGTLAESRVSQSGDASGYGDRAHLAASPERAGAYCLEVGRKGHGSEFETVIVIVRGTESILTDADDGRRDRYRSEFPAVAE